MKIVILDGYALNPGDLSWNSIEDLGECFIYNRTQPFEVIERIGDAEAVITNKVLINDEIINHLPNLKYIGVTATGYNVVDVAAANKNKIVVTNIPAYSTSSVAQLVFSHILNVVNRVDLHSNSVKSGDWTKSPDFAYWKSQQTELAGKVIGIIGFGRIGRKVAQIAHSFEMKILFYNRSIKTDLSEGMIQTSLSSVFKQSDFLSLNCPLTSDNLEFVDKDLLETMKPSAVLINTGRGGLINETDLADALNSGRIAAACLDVLSTEPPLPENPLLSAVNCFITPHIGWTTFEARQRLMNIAADNLMGFIEGNYRNRVGI
jgi:glycerate dehydrogenase